MHLLGTEEISASFRNKSKLLFKLNKSICRDIYLITLTICIFVFSLIFFLLNKFGCVKSSDILVSLHVDVNEISLSKVVHAFFEQEVFVKAPLHLHTVLSAKFGILKGAAKIGLCFTKLYGVPDS